MTTDPTSIPEVPITIGVPVVHVESGAAGVVVAAGGKEGEWLCWMYGKGRKPYKSSLIRVDIDSQLGFMYLVTWALMQGCRKDNLFPPLRRRYYMENHLLGVRDQDMKDALLGELRWLTGAEGEG